MYDHISVITNKLSQQLKKLLMLFLNVVLKSVFPVLEI